MTRLAAVTGSTKASSDVVSRPLRNGPQGCITRWLVLHTWAQMGTLSAAIALTLFFADLLHAGWRPGSPVGVGSPLHAAYREATTATFIAVIASQVGAGMGAWAAPTRLRRIEISSNPALTGAVLLSAALCFAPPVQRLVVAGALHAWVVLLIAACPAAVWGAQKVARRIHSHRLGHSNTVDTRRAPGNGHRHDAAAAPREGRAR